ncbi:MAG: hypothetical protein HFG50_08575 [Lachnospiraceae bacterium]|nr:hypothetical protein [Lachnospiraceae bacterium]
MGKKNMVMRRIAALLIVSLMLTSSAFTSLAATNSGSAKKGFKLEKDSGDLNLTVGKEGTLSVRIEDASIASASILASDADAAANMIVWDSKDKSVATVEPASDKLSCTVMAVKEGNTTVTAKAGKAVVEFKVEVVADKPVTEVTLALDKKELNLMVGDSDKLTATVKEDDKVVDAKVQWILSKQGIVSIDADGKVTALEVGTVTVTAEATVNNKTVADKCEVKVEYKPHVEEIQEPELSEDMMAEFKEPEKAKESIKKQTDSIKDAVEEAAKNSKIETTEETKKIFEGIDEIPDDSELKLLSVNTELEVEMKNGKPVVDEAGNPVVVIKELAYNISLVDGNGAELSHGLLKNNTKEISINVALPATGIKKECKFATIKHYADEECKNLLETLYSKIFGSEDMYITIKTKQFSPFVMTFSVEDPNPTPTNNGGSSSGGGSRKHVVGGGSSTNSYSMTGNWVMGANGWTFVKSDGKLATNTWGWINGQYYYFDANGNMMTGWQFINGKWYCLNPAEGSLLGAMLSGVIFDPVYNAYFYADASGAMVTGWYQVGANWYYFSPVNDGVHVTGALLSGTYVDGYYLGADGAWVPGN